MTRHALTLSRPDHRAIAPAWFNRAMELGWRVAFMEPKRSLAQNDRLWELLGRVEKRMTLTDRKFTAEQWKVIFMQATGHKAEFLPALDGSFFPTGFRSSDLGTREMADLQTFIETWCAEKGVDIWETEA